MGKKKTEREKTRRRKKKKKPQRSAVREEKKNHHFLKWVKEDIIRFVRGSRKVYCREKMEGFEKREKGLY